MPQNFKSRSRSVLQPLLLVAVIIVAALLGAGLYYHFWHHTSKATVTPVSTKTYAPPAAADNNASNDRKGSSAPSSTLDNGSSSKPPAPTANFNAQIVSSNVSNGNVHVGTLVSGTTTGNCTLTATKSGQPTLQLGSSSVRQDVNNYDCGVFNVSTSKFPEAGSWQLILTLTKDGASSTSSASVNI